MSNIDGCEMFLVDVSLQQEKGNAKKTCQQLGLAQVAVFKSITKKVHKKCASYDKLELV